MLREEEKINPNAIEKHVVNRMREANKESLSPDLADFLLKLLKNPMPSATLKIRDSKKPPIYAYIEKCVDDNFRYNLSDKRLVLFLASLSKTQGIALMYLWYLQWWCCKNNLKEINLMLFCRQIFPDGFPSAEDILTIYNEQKITTGQNLIDYISAGKSLLEH